MPKFIRQIDLPVTTADAFDWHERPGAFVRLLPPWQKVEVLEARGGIRDGAKVTLRISQGPIRFRWKLEHRDYDHGRLFRDVQTSGPFRAWSHHHRFEDGRNGGSPDAPDAPGSPGALECCRLVDEIDFEPPFGFLGRWIGAPIILRDLQRLFGYRHAVTRDDLAFHRRLAVDQPKTVAISGAGGLLGTVVSAILTTGGHRVLRLVRHDKPLADDEVRWHPEKGVAGDSLERLEGIDAVIHLAGVGIADRRWTEAQKRAIRDSRVQGTAGLVQSLSELSSPPKAFVGASAIGLYGSRGDEVLTEGSSRGGGFLADVTAEWEEQTKKIEQAGVRVALARIGVVLTSRGGALKTMLPAFRFGMGGPVGGGRQFMSWISHDDCASALVELALREQLSGAFNLAAPEPVRQGEFARILGRLLRRPAFAPAPAFAVRAMFGSMADETVLSSIRAVPERLQSGGFVFRHPDVQSALSHVLGVKAR